MENQIEPNQKAFSPRKNTQAQRQTHSLANKIQVTRRACRPFFSFHPSCNLAVEVLPCSPKKGLVAHMQR